MEKNKKQTFFYDYAFLVYLVTIEHTINATKEWV